MKKQRERERKSWYYQISQTKSGARYEKRDEECTVYVVLAITAD